MINPIGPSATFIATPRAFCAMDAILVNEVNFCMAAPNLAKPSIESAIAIADISLAMTSSASSPCSPIRNKAPSTAAAPRATPPITSPNLPNLPSRSADSYVSSISLTLFSACWIDRANLSNSLEPISVLRSSSRIASIDSSSSAMFVADLEVSMSNCMLTVSSAIIINLNTS